MPAVATRSSEDAVARYVDRLLEVFRASPSKHEAHRRSRAIMAEMSADAGLLSAVLGRHLAIPGALNARHYPVLGFEIDSNPWFELVANAWIPLPDGRTDLSTKAIHHHGDVLLTTATAFGPGYEHLMLTRPAEVDAQRGLYRMELIEQGPHPLHDVAFVDAYTAHVPLYPPLLTITLCLWSHQGAKTWRDEIKRLGIVRRHSPALRRLVVRLGLGRQLEVRTAEFFDFFPSAEGFVGIREREEFPLGPNADHLHCLFHVLQETGNSRLAAVARERVAAGDVEDPDLVLRLIDDLEAGRRIEPRLSPGHHGVPQANFTRAEVEQALAGQPLD